MIGECLCLRFFVDDDNSHTSHLYREPGQQERDAEASTKIEIDEEDESIEDESIDELFSESEHRDIFSQQKSTTTTTSSNHESEHKMIGDSSNSIDFDHTEDGQKPDPVYLDDEKVFENLILKERHEEKRLSLDSPSGKQQERHQQPRQLSGHLRHSLLSWMLRVCEHQQCQDEIFPLATMIMDKFLHFHPTSSNILQSTSQDLIEHHNHHHHQQQQEELTTMTTDQDGEGSLSPTLQCDEHWAQLRQRQLCLFAACSLLLATKLRQTPRLCIVTLIEFSRLELPIELTREEIIDGELLILATLKWDLAALVTPNDYLAILTRKCSRVAAKFLYPSSAEEEAKDLDLEPQGAVSGCRPEDSTDEMMFTSTTEGARLNVQVYNNDNNSIDNENHTAACGGASRPQQGNHLSQTTPGTLNGADISNNNNSRQQNHRLRLNRCDEARVWRHTQTLLELCLMDAQLSQFSPSILAMSTMAVAIDGLSMLTCMDSCWRLHEIVRQIYESTNKVNELKQMIDVAFKIEKYVQKLLRARHTMIAYDCEY